MERRESKRIKKRSILKINNTPAILLDFSRKGISFSMNKAPINRGVDILFDIGDQTFEIKATTCWIKQKIALSKSFDIGAFIEEAPEEYYQFVDNQRN